MCGILLIYFNKCSFLVHFSSIIFNHILSKSISPRIIVLNTVFHAMLDLECALSIVIVFVVVVAQMLFVLVVRLMNIYLLNWTRRLNWNETASGRQRWCSDYNDTTNTRIYNRKYIRQINYVVYECINIIKKEAKQKETNLNQHKAKLKIDDIHNMNNIYKNRLRNHFCCS